MVRISDINKDLDKYIAGRREKTEWSFFSKAKPRKEKREDPVPDDLKADSVHVIQDDSEPGFWSRLFNKQEEPVSEDLSPEEMARLEAMQQELKEIDRIEQEHPEAVEVLEDERESVMDKFLNLFRGFERKHKLEHDAERLEMLHEEMEAKLDQDVVLVLKAMHKWLNKLPKRHKDEFKKSNDFQAYKKLLEKYGVAKAVGIKEPKGEPKDSPKIEIID